MNRIDESKKSKSEFLKKMTLWICHDLQVSKVSTLMIVISFFVCHKTSFAQQVIHYNLIESLRENKLVSTSKEQEIMEYVNPQNQAIAVKGILWLKDTDFKEGTIDIDLRGKDVFLNSFMGIAFHAKDTNSYDVVYFCPFRFHDTNSIARKWAVKYMSLPDNSYLKLRESCPGVYENEVIPAPMPNKWFHATIVVKEDSISVYVDHSQTASLKVKKLNTLDSGKIGLWSYSKGLSSDFANLTISPMNSF